MARIHRTIHRTIIFIFITIFLCISTGVNPCDTGTEQKPVKVDIIEKTQVRLLLIDAIIEDRKENQVRGMTKDDFHLFIDGFEKPISVFEEHCSESYVERKEFLQNQASLSDSAVYEEVSEPRYIIFCFGSSRPALGGPYEAVKAATQFVLHNMRSSDRVMVASFVNDIKVIQPFTSDRQKLLHAIDEIKKITPLHFESMPCIAGPGKFGFMLDDDDMGNRIAIGNFRSLIALLAPIRERKALVYFCSSLYLTPGLSRLVNEINSARISVYTVDMAGLTAPGQRRGEDYIFNAFSSLSIDTGGKVLKWSNDLTRYIPVVEKDLSCYYLIGCYLDKEPDGKQHALSLIARETGLIVRSRTGFVYFTEEQLKSQKEKSRALINP